MNSNRGIKKTGRFRSVYWQSGQPEHSRGPQAEITLQCRLMNILDHHSRFPADLAVIVGTIALVGVWWWTFSHRTLPKPQSLEPPPPKEEAPKEPERTLTKREEFYLRQKPLAPLDDFVKRRHEKYKPVPAETPVFYLSRILAARPIKKKKPQKVEEYSSDEDKNLYRLDPEVLQRHSNKSLYEAYSYTSDDPHGIAEEDKDQVIYLFFWNRTGFNC